jgi:hypothetical protein
MLIFFCGLFNDSFSVPKPCRFGRYDERWKVWERYGRKQTWPSRGITPDLSEGTEETHENLRTAGVPGVIRTEHLQNTNL